MAQSHSPGSFDEKDYRDAWFTKSRNFRTAKTEGYLFAFAAFAGNDGEFRVRFANGEELDNWQTGPTMSQYANKQGENGWELLACHPIVFTQSNEQQYPEIYCTSSELRAIEMVFKRPQNGDGNLQSQSL